MSTSRACARRAATASSASISRSGISLSVYTDLRLGSALATSIRVQRPRQLEQATARGDEKVIPTLTGLCQYLLEMYQRLAAPPALVLVDTAGCGMDEQREEEGDSTGNPSEARVAFAVARLLAGVLKYNTTLETLVLVGCGIDAEGAVALEVALEVRPALRRRARLPSHLPSEEQQRIHGAAGCEDRLGPAQQFRFAHPPPQ